MKEPLWSRILGKVLLVAAALLLIAGIAAAGYLEDRFGLSRFFWAFNGAVLLCSPLYYGLRLLHEKRKKKKIEKTTVLRQLDIPYYRGILTDYSPGMAAFLYRGSAHPVTDLMASVIYLIQEGCLALEGGRLAKTGQPALHTAADLRFLHTHAEELFLPRIPQKVTGPGGKTREEPARSTQLATEWCDMIRKEAVDRGLVLQREISPFPSVLLVLCVLEALYLLLIEGRGLLLVFAIVLVAVLLGLQVFAFLRHEYPFTQSGADVYAHLKGLSNYLKDFTLLNERQVEEVTLWRDYLIYAIIFDHKTPLSADADRLYQSVRQAMARPG